VPDSSQRTSESSQSTFRFNVSAVLLGPISPHQDINQVSQRVLKTQSDNRSVFTEITLADTPRGRPRQRGANNVDYYVQASSPEMAWRVAVVYLGQICDLLSAVTKCPVDFCRQEDDLRDARARMLGHGTSVERVLTRSEWDWITGNLAHLRSRHKRYLIAASWYRKGLLNNDALDRFSCFWRSVEKTSAHYSDKTQMDEENKRRPKAQIKQLIKQLFPADAPECVKTFVQQVDGLYQLRNDVAHGNKAILPELIEQCDIAASQTEQAAFRILETMRHAGHLAATEC
jgi:hypothetical protein